MPTTTKSTFKYIGMFPGILVLLIGSVVLFGWIFGIPALTRINPEWNPMVPMTALCFLLSAMALLTCKGVSGLTVTSVQRTLIWLILLLAGGKIIALVSGYESEFAYLETAWLSHSDNVGHMSAQTAAGFLAFGIGILFMQRAGYGKTRLLTRTLAGVLLASGLGVMLGYWLNFQDIFEPVYIRAGMIWMSMPTALSMTLLGIGLWRLSHQQDQDSQVTATGLNAARINRATLIVVAVTSIATALIGLQFLNKTVIEQSSSAVMQRLNANRDYIVNDLDNRTQRALLAGLEPEFQAAVTAFLHNTNNKQLLSQATHLTEHLLAHGFTGIGLDTGGRIQTIAGRLLPLTIPIVRLNGENDSSLAWDKGYVLRVRVPLNSHDTPDGFLVFEQTLPYLNKMFDDANRWGETGTMPMCVRLNQKQLLCFPQREQRGIYVVPDTINGKPLPMTYALTGQVGTKSLVDYRGRHVLSAYGPLGHTGLGLVLRMDLAELYLPARNELLISIPLIALLVFAGLWVIRTRVKPLIQELACAHAVAAAAQVSFNAAMQSSPDGFVIYEKVMDQIGEIIDFRCVYLNQNAKKMVGLTLLGKTAEDLLGKTFVQVFPERGEDFALYKQVAQTGNLKIDELSLTVDSNKLWLLRQVVHMPQGIAITYRDITQEKCLMQQLENSNRLRTAIVEGAAYSIISTDVDGNILSFNQAAERMLCYRAEELIGQATPAVFHDAEEVRLRAERLSQELGYTVEPGFGVFVAKAEMNFVEELEWTYVRKDGSRFPVLLSVTALRDESDHINGYLGIAYDISERKRIDQMKNEFISTISHELRTPLTSISGALGLIAGGVLGEIPEKAKQMVQMAHKNSLLLASLINDLLDMDKLVAGKMELDLRRQPLIPLIVQSLESISAYGEQYKVCFKFIAQEEVDVQVDSSRIIQVMNNFLSNAAKFSAQGGQVSIAVRRLSGAVRVEVIDHGSGIPKHFRERIFQKFAQADSSDTRQKGGTGLGLAISKELIERMHGKIGFDSIEGQGSCFYFDLPLNSD